jgi:hypothetical protein
MNLLISKNSRKGRGLLVMYAPPPGPVRIDYQPTPVRRGGTFRGVKYVDLMRAMRKSGPGVSVEFPDPPEPAAEKT